MMDLAALRRAGELADTLSKRGNGEHPTSITIHVDSSGICVRGILYVRLRDAGSEYTGFCRITWAELDIANSDILERAVLAVSEQLGIF